MAEILVITLMALIAVYVFFDRMGRPRGIEKNRLDVKRDRARK
jgi:hypothetical protein